MPRLRLSNRATRLAVALLWLVAIAIAAVISAELLTRLIETEPVHARVDGTSDPRAAARQIIGRAPMATVDTQIAPNAATPRESLDYTLIGLATGFGDAPGFALLRPANGPVFSASVGETIAPGVTLAAIHADRVELSRGNVRETITLTRTLAQGAPSPVVVPQRPQSIPANQR